MYRQKFSLNKQDSKESKIARKAILKTQNTFKTQNISYTQNTSNIPLNHLAQFDMILKHV